MRTELVRLCYQCGVCVAACPVRKVKNLSPRSIIYGVLTASPGEKLERCGAWDCLLCNECLEACPQSVDFPSFVLSLREDAGMRKEVLAHRGIFTEIAELMALLDNGIAMSFAGETSNFGEGEYGYFPGCLDFFDLFMDVDANFHEIGDASIKLLNAAGIKPQLLSLKCCGHDVLYQGNKELFETLKAFNAQKIKESGVKKLVVSCAECLHTFKKYYELDVEVLHISEVLSDALKSGALELRSAGRIVTYHDPCSLGRHLGIYDAPREVLRMCGVKLVEMEHSRERAQCCGVSGMMNCNDFAKALRLLRLEEAEATGAEVLVTTCPKCVAHLNCLRREMPEKIKTLDLTVFLGRLLDSGEQVYQDSGEQVYQDSGEQ